MRHLAIGIAIVVAQILVAQVPTTSIVGPVYDTYGNPYTGSFSVQAMNKTNSGWAVTGQPQRTIYVTAGSIQSFSLVPNDTSVPNLTSYLVQFANGDRWVCFVSTSSTPLPFTQVCSPNATPPNTSTPFSASQIIPSPTPGQVLTTIGGMATWAAAPPAPPLVAGTYCLTVTSPSVPSTWTPCSGGGGLSLATLTNPTLAALSNAQLLAMTN